MADESGFSDHGYFAMAGFISHDAAWSRFNVLWNDALARHRAPYLHMKEFSGFRGSYEGWTEGQRRSLMADLLAVITNSPMRIIGAALKISDFTRLTRRVQDILDGPYVLCFNQMILGTGIHRQLLVPGEKLDFVYSRQDQFRARMSKMWEKSRQVPEYGKDLRTLAFNDMRTTPGLQAADLLVYEYRHYYHLRDTRPELRVRHPFRVLLDNDVRNGGVMLNYMPGWHIEFQAKSCQPEAMQVIASDLDTWGSMYTEVQPPGVNGIQWFRQRSFEVDYRPKRR